MRSKVANGKVIVKEAQGTTVDSLFKFDQWLNHAKMQRNLVLEHCCAFHTHRQVSCCSGRRHLDFQYESGKAFFEWSGSGFSMLFLASSQAWS